MTVSPSCALSTAFLTPLVSTVTVPSLLGTTSTSTSTSIPLTVCAVEEDVDGCVEDDVEVLGEVSGVVWEVSETGVSSRVTANSSARGRSKGGSLEERVSE